MNGVLRAYFQAFLHPFKVQEDLRTLRLERSECSIHQAQQKLSLLPDAGSDGEAEPHGVARKATSDDCPDGQCRSRMRRQDGLKYGQLLELSFLEVLSVSWLMATLQALILGLLIGAGWWWFTLNFADSYAVSWANNALAAGQWQVFFALLFKAALFPLHLWVFSRLWLYSIRFFGRLIGTSSEEDLEEGGQQVVNGALSAHTFLLLPVLGSLAFHAAFLISLYAGLSRNLRWPPLQSLSALLAPLFLFFLLGLFLLLSLALFFSALVF